MSLPTIQFDGVTVDGRETVRLYGTDFDVTGKDKLVAFKTEYEIVRPKAKKEKREQVTKEDD